MLCIAVLLPSSAFVEKYFGVSAVFLYLCLGCAGLGAASLAMPWFESRPQRRALVLAVLGMSVVALVFLVMYPIANVHVPGKGSDSDDALDITTLALLHGRYPYGQATYLGNPAIPMPGEMVLAIPAVLLGGSAYQILLWLPIAFRWISRFARSNGNALWLFSVVMVLSPTVMHGIIVGSDHFPNSTIVFTGFCLTHIAITRRAPRLHRWGALAFLGLALSTRINFVFVTPVLMASIARTVGVRTAIASLAAACGIALAVTMPFYLFDPAHFAPLHTATKTGSVPHGQLVVPAVTLAVALWRSLRVGPSLESALSGAFVVLLVPVLILTCSVLLRDRHWYMAAYGDLAMLFGLASYGVRWVLSHQQRGSSAVEQPTLA